MFCFPHHVFKDKWKRCRIRKDAPLTHQIAVGVYQLDVHPSADPQKIRRTDDIFRGVPRVADWKIVSLKEWDALHLEIVGLNSSMQRIIF